MTRIERMSLPESVAAALREMIMTGQLQVGEPIPQDAVARDLGVSRTPMREALARLSAEGLITMEQHRPAVVRRPSLKELFDIYEMRTLLERLAAKYAARRIEDAHFATLEELLNRLDGITSPEKWAALNSEFHLTMYAAADRPRLLQVITSLRNQSDVYVRMLIASGHSDQAQSDHRCILEALRHRDESAIETATEIHLGHTRDRLLEVLGDDHSPHTTASS